MASKAQSIRQLSLIFAASLAASTASAAELYFYDGNAKRSLVVDQSNWAAVEKNAAVAPIAIRSAETSEKRALQDTSSSSGKQTVKSLSGSPVFRVDGVGQAMALPGGLIVVPKNGDVTAATNQLKAQGLTVERTVGGTNALLVTSPAGLASLDLANRLHESGSFESVSPNWWRERRKK